MSEDSEEKMRLLRDSKGLCRAFGVLLLGVGYLPTFFSPRFFVQKENNGVAGVTLNTMPTEELLQKSDNLLTAFTDTENLKWKQILKNSLKEETGGDKNKELSVSSDKIHEKIKETKAIVSQHSTKELRFGPFAKSTIVKGVVSSNFYVDALRFGVPAKVIDSMVKNLSGKVNFRRSLKKGNVFEVMFDKKKRLLYCSIQSGKNNKVKSSVYGIDENGKLVYYRDDGTRVNAPTPQGFGKPLAGALSITSPYGIRIHPITRQKHYHSGVDLKARYGAPIFAIASGKVIRASRYAGYGNCVEILHDNGYKSLYGHLSSYAVRCGMRVVKGQKIGAAGSTGFSTGPHLHLELARYDRKMNPLGVKMMASDSGRIGNVQRFREHKRQIQNVFNAL